MEVLPFDDHLWLRGPCPSNDETQLLRVLPGVRPFLLGDDGLLTLVGERVPRVTLPAGTWQPLKHWLRVTFPAARTSVDANASLPDTASLTLVRCHEECDATLLLTSLSTWNNYANQAPQWRLERLAFVMNDASQILLRGTPLPPLPGERWIDFERICVPAGWKWSPHLQPAVLVEMMGLQPGDIALLFPPPSSNSAMNKSLSWRRARGGRLGPRLPARPFARRRRPGVSLTNGEIREYFATHSSWLWDWKDRGEVLAWSDNSTIAFRQEISAVLARLEPLGFPRFGAVVLLLGTCRDGWEISPIGKNALDEFLSHFQPTDDLYRIINRVIHGLQEVHALRSLCTSLQAKAELAAVVFEAAESRVSPLEARRLRIAFEDGLIPATILARSSASRDSLLHDLLNLDDGIRKIDRASLELRLKTGLDTPVEAAVVELPSGESVRDLIRQLEDDRELGGVEDLPNSCWRLFNCPDH